MPCSAWTTWSPGDRVLTSWMNLSARRGRRRGGARLWPAAPPAVSPRAGGGGAAEPVAQQVVLAQDVEGGSDEAALKRQDGDPRHRDPGEVSGVVDARDRVEAVVGQDLLQALGRAFAIGGEERPGAGGHQLAQVADDGVEQVVRAVGTLGREVACRAAAEVADGGYAGGPGRGRAEGRELPGRAGVRQPGEILLVDVELLGRQRAGGDGAEGRAGGGRRGGGLGGVAGPRGPGPCVRPGPGG